ncbi:MAG: nucleotidyltransferase domain-containing protein [Opitutaceae bacterium]|nr:nucleotidyltransferase domain-containing protein [Opitutaceae bacterium]
MKTKAEAHAPELSTLQASLKPACLKHGIKGVEIFGSVARGEAGPDSDLDLIIEFQDPDRQLNFSDLLAIQEDFSTAAGMEVQILTKEDYLRIKNPFFLISVDEDRRELLRL